MMYLSNSNLDLHLPRLREELKDQLIIDSDGCVKHPFIIAVVGVCSETLCLEGFHGLYEV